MSAAADSSAPLAGIKVLDLSEVWQAPLATQALADFGAEVIKVERPGPGDIMRGLDRHAVATGGVSCYFAAVNRNKRSLVLNIKEEEGLAAVLRMVERVDVFVHNFRPGVMERFGLGYGELAARNPGLVYATASGFGESGPLAAKGGQDMLAQSISGLAMHVAHPDMPPYLHPTPFIDYASGMNLAQGILAALLERERSGEGQKVSISLFDTAIAIQMSEAASRLVYDYETNWVSQWFPNAVFETADGWITVLGLFRPNPLGKICEALGIEDLSRRPEYATPELQAERKDELNEIVAAEFRKRPREELLELLDGVDVLCAPVLGLEEALEHPQAVHNGATVEVELAGDGRARVLANPLRLSRTPAAPGRQRIAAMGEDTGAVLAEMGFDEKEIERLRAHGAPPDGAVIAGNQNETRSQP